MIRNGLYQVQSEGYWPILAHAERYECLVKDFRQLEVIYDMGIYIQVNADSVTNIRGFTRKQFMKRIFKNDMVHFIGTDAHDAKERRPQIEPCIHYLEKKCGKESIQRYFTENPQHILEHQML